MTRKEETEAQRGGLDRGARLNLGWNDCLGFPLLCNLLSKDEMQDQVLGF